MTELSVSRTAHPPLKTHFRSLEIREQKLPRPNYLDQELINTSLLIKPLCLKSGTGICTTGKNEKKR